jgi:hypothetical protein
MTRLAADQLRDLIVRARARYREIDHANWDTESGRYRTPSDTTKWVQAARETAPAEWVEAVRILAQGWDYYGGSDLPGEGRA